MSEIIVRPYQPGDEVGIVSLFNKVFPQKISLEHWRWKYQENSAGFPLISVAVDGTKIVAHRSYIPANFVLGGKVVKATHSVDFMVHPHYRKRGITGQMSQLTGQQLRTASISFNYTFPMPHVEALVKHLTGFKTAFPVPSWAKLRNPAYFLKRPLLRYPSIQSRFRTLGLAMLKGRPQQPSFQQTTLSKKLNLKHVDEYDESADILWNTVADRHRVSRIRDTRYLNWRYDPKRYSKLAFYNGPKLNGFVVVAVDMWHGWVIGHIVDVLAIDSHSVRVLLDGALDNLRDQGVDLIRCWISPDAIVEPELVRLGFRSRPPPGNVLVGVYDHNIDGDILLNPENWYLTQGDADGV